MRTNAARSARGRTRGPLSRRRRLGRPRTGAAYVAPAAPPAPAWGAAAAAEVPAAALRWWLPRRRWRRRGRHRNCPAPAVESQQRCDAAQQRVWRRETDLPVGERRYISACAQRRTGVSQQRTARSVRAWVRLGGWVYKTSLRNQDRRIERCEYLLLE
jgi:hypothetical protein